MTEPLVRVAAVTLRYGAVAAVDGVSLTIAPGELLGLVGESGSGKTTLGRALVGMQRPSRGRILVAGEDVYGSGGAGRLHRARTAQMIFQDPLASLSPRLTVRALLREPMRIHGLAETAYGERLDRLLAALDLPPAILWKHPHEISGGQARRVGVARALVLQPRLVVADEPTAGLDVSVQGDLLNLLRDLQGELGLTLLMVSHNLAVLRRVADRVAVMYAGQLVESGAAAAVFAVPAHPYAAALIAATPRLGHRRGAPPALPGEPPSPAHPPAGCRFHPRCPRAAARCAAEVPEPREILPGRMVRCHFPLVGEA